MTEATQQPGVLWVGARGWDHPGWQDNYYPEDLPRDWRLSFYANEFSGVLVPPHDWQGAEPGDWRDEVVAPFRFFLELPWELAPLAGVSSANHQWQTVAHGLGERLGGIVLRLPADTPALGALGSGLSSVVRACAGVSVHVDFGRGRSMNEAQCRLLEELRVQPCWHGVSPGPAGCVGLIGADGDDWDLPVLKDLMGEFAQWASACESAHLFLEGMPPSIERLHQAQTLRDLMGL